MPGYQLNCCVIMLIGWFNCKLMFPGIHTHRHQGNYCWRQHGGRLHPCLASSQGDQGPSACRIRAIWVWGNPQDYCQVNTSKLKMCLRTRDCWNMQFHALSSILAHTYSKQHVWVGTMCCNNPSTDNMVWVVTMCCNIYCCYIYISSSYSVKGGIIIDGLELSNVTHT